MSVSNLFLILIACTHANQLAVHSSAGLSLNRVYSACNFDGPDSVGVVCVTHICEKLQHLNVARPPCCNVTTMHRVCEANLRFGDWPWVSMANTEWSDCVAQQGGPDCDMIRVVRQVHESLLSEIQSARSGAQNDSAALLTKIEALLANNTAMAAQLERITSETSGIRTIMQTVANATSWVANTAREPMQMGANIVNFVLAIAQITIWVCTLVALVSFIILFRWCFGWNPVTEIVCLLGRSLYQLGAWCCFQCAARKRDLAEKRVIRADLIPLIQSVGALPEPEPARVSYAPVPAMAQPMHTTPVRHYYNMRIRRPPGSK